MDQVSVKKVASLAFLLVIMLLMALPPASAPAPTLMKKNNNGTTAGCNNGIREEGEETCRLIAHDYLDMEFMMGSGISRMLDEKSKQNKVVYPSLVTGPVCERKRGGPYATCASKERPIKPPGHCYPTYRPPCTTP
ncbi:hypothetical protein I3843_14G101900 [Carya illinoinensis]|nr:hypothetical protein I3843_14G101900 [Carya illinoinensis]